MELGISHLKHFNNENTNDNDGNGIVLDKKMMINCYFCTAITKTSHEFDFGSQFRNLIASNITHGTELDVERLKLPNNNYDVYYHGNSIVFRSKC